MARAVMVDLDGTVADCAWRAHLLAAGNADDHALSCGGDQPIDAVVELVRILKRARYQIVFVTERSDIAEQETYRWLEKHDLPCDMLMMRGMGDRTGTPEMKANAYKALGRMGYTVAMAIDDDPETARKLDEAGCRTLLVQSSVK